MNPTWLDDFMAPAASGSVARAAEERPAGRDLINAINAVSAAAPDGGPAAAARAFRRAVSAAAS